MSRHRGQIIIKILSYLNAATCWKKICILLTDMMLCTQVRMWWVTEIDKSFFSLSIGCNKIDAHTESQKCTHSTTTVIQAILHFLSLPCHVTRHHWFISISIWWRVLRRHLEREEPVQKNLEGDWTNLPSKWIGFFFIASPANQQQLKASYCARGNISSSV